MPLGKLYSVYIMTNKPYGTLYIGVTSNLMARALQHKNKFQKGFTEKYNLNRLVYFDSSENVHGAIEYEKRLKKWKRAWKIRLIESTNPQWEDLFLTLRW